MKPRTPAEVDYLLDEVEHLIAGGVWPPQALQRLGWDLTGAERAARRRDRTRLSSLLRNHLRAEQRGELVAS